MKKIELKNLHTTLEELLMKLGLSKEDASRVTGVYMDATYRGVGHHDIYDIPWRLKSLKLGRVNPSTSLPVLGKYGAMEQCDGENALGELICDLATERAMKLADEYGIGVCACRNTNHFLCGATYSQRAAEKGYIAMVFAKEFIDVGPKAAEKPCISSLPLSWSYPTDTNEVVMDFCLAYTSVGQLKDCVKKEKKIKPWWGVDGDGQYCDEPKIVKEEGMRLMVGDHKGFALAMFGEVITGVLSGGTVMDEPKVDGMNYSTTSHTIIVMKANAFQSQEEFEKRASIVGNRAKELSGVDLHLPGDGSRKNREKILAQGYIELEEDLIEKINAYAEELGVDALKKIPMS